MSFRKNLIKLGDNNPDLRGHIKSILDKVSGNKTLERDLENELDVPMPSLNHQLADSEPGTDGEYHIFEGGPVPGYEGNIEGARQFYKDVWDGSNRVDDYIQELERSPRQYSLVAESIPTSETLQFSQSDADLYVKIGSSGLMVKVRQTFYPHTRY